MSFVYPKIEQGTQVEWAQDGKAPDNQWLLGEVTAVKNESCDIVLPGYMHGGRHDCWHVDDPRCSTRSHEIREPDRGVFRLSKKELALRRMMTFIEEEVPTLRAEMASLRKAMEEQVIGDAEGKRMAKAK